MNKYAVITENDESPWEDIKGEVYHFPNMYMKILTPGCKVIYYTGRMKDERFIPHRLSREAHYFGYGEVGEVVDDPLSKKGDLFCEIVNYREFKEAIPITNGDYLEPIPESRRLNYWRFGVREIDQATYERIIALSGAGLITKKIRLPSYSGELESTKKEGKRKQRYSTYYERNPFNRRKAIEVHGLDCMVCGFNFAHKYGSTGEGFIHVHHLKPVSELDKEVFIDPQIDLAVVCANCHALIHRDKDNTLSLEELKSMIA